MRCSLHVKKAPLGGTSGWGRYPQTWDSAWDISRIQQRLSLSLSIPLTVPGLLLWWESCRYVCGVPFAGVSWEGFKAPALEESLL